MKGATRARGRVRGEALRVSIHAPVKGATDVVVADIVIPPVVSIHAPVKGATRTSASSPSTPTSFNPRTREGCDDALRERCSAALVVSIHAPVKGATCRPFTMPVDCVFQSTHP